MAATVIGMKNKPNVVSIHSVQFSKTNVSTCLAISGGGKQMVSLLKLKTGSHGFPVAKAPLLIGMMQHRELFHIKLDQLRIKRERVEHCSSDPFRVHQTLKR
jgi:aspartate-semialdehyde dehydrogenase